MRKLFQLKAKPHGIDRMRLFLEQNFICIGWPGIGDLKGADRDEIRRRLKQTYNYSGQQLGAYTGAINCFANTMQAGDVVLVPYGSIVHVGIIDDYHYVPAFDNNTDGMCHQRNVQWVAILQKSDLNDKVLEFVRNRGILTTFPLPFPMADLDQYLGEAADTDETSKILVTNPVREESIFDEETIQKAIRVLKEALGSSDFETRLRAATEILRLTK
jgi:hypothetical protein